jgi:hypothetical protein
MQQAAQSDLRPYNKELPKWIDALDRVKPSGKGGRALKRKAIANLNQAHDGHGNETFNFDGEGNKLVLHDCAGAQEAEHAAAAAGDPAWFKEFQGLVAARKLLHLKGSGTTLSPQVGPWGDAGVH